jgi:hypothetical protein
VDAGPIPAAAEQGGERQGVLLSAVAGGHLGQVARDYCERLSNDSRILAWAEGIHLRAEYLDARNAVLAQLIRSNRPLVIALETNFALSRRADAYVLGSGPDEPDDEIVRSVWSWGSGPLAQNAALLRLLRRHNAGRSERDRVRIYGLEMYAGDGSDPDSLDHRRDREHARLLADRLAAHRAVGGDHREVGGRDAAQFATLLEVLDRHPDARVFLFEQTAHLDRRVPGSLASHLAADPSCSASTVGALWSGADPTVSFPLGPYAELSEWLSTHRDELVPVVDGVDLLDLAAGVNEQDPVVRESQAAFDGLLFAPRLTPVG